MSGGYTDYSMTWLLHLQITESGDLVIRDVTWSNNMGLYKCYAHNSHGSDHIDTFLYPVSSALRVASFLQQDQSQSAR